MDEKEFLLAAIQFLIEAKGSLQYGMEALDLDRVKESVSRDLDDFIKYHHQSYLPVWFHLHDSRDETYKKAVREQSKIKMQDFLKYLDVNLDDDYVGAKIDAYLDQKI